MYMRAKKKIGKSKWLKVISSLLLIRVLAILEARMRVRPIPRRVSLPVICELTKEGRKIRGRRKTMAKRLIKERVSKALVCCWADMGLIVAFLGSEYKGFFRYL